MTHKVLPVGTKVRHKEGFHGDDQRFYPAGVEGVVMSHGALGYHGVEFELEGKAEAFLVLAEELEPHD